MFMKFFSKGPHMILLFMGLPLKDFKSKIDYLVFISYFIVFGFTVLFKTQNGT